METSPAMPTGRRTVKVVSDDDADIAALRAEIARLRDLVGPGEESYTKLRLDLLGAKDAAIAAEAAAGRLRGRIVELESEVAKLRRDYLWFRQKVINQILSPRTRRMLRPAIPILRRARSLVRR